MAYSSHHQLQQGSTLSLHTLREGSGALSNQLAPCNQRQRFVSTAIIRSTPTMLFTSLKVTAGNIYLCVIGLLLILLYASRFTLYFYNYISGMDFILLSEQLAFPPAPTSSCDLVHDDRLCSVLLCLDPAPVLLHFIHHTRSNKKILQACPPQMYHFLILIFIYS